MGDAAQVVALVGLRGAGKTSVGRLLAQRLGLPFEDLDQRLAAVAPGDCASAGEVLRQLGQERFRELESSALRACLAQPGSRVLATGGGVVEREANRELLLGHCRCLWLVAEPGTLRQRTAADRSERPALTELDPVAEIELLAKRRAALYQEVSEASFETGGLALDEVLELLLSYLRS